MRFEWDIVKAEENLRKHGVSFEEAIHVFYDPFALEEFDADHSDDEERFIRIGFVQPNVLFVVFIAKDEQSEIYRVISARKAEKRYESIYWEERRQDGG